MIQETEMEQYAQSHMEDKFSLKMPADQLGDNKTVESTVGECKTYCMNDYIAGMKKSIEVIKNQDKWKDLYAEGIAVGRKIERAIITGKPME